MVRYFLQNSKVNNELQLAWAHETGYNLPV
jgi:hypothetical protein